MEKEKKKKKRYQLVWEREAGGFFTVALEHEQCQGKFLRVTVTNVNALKQSIFFLILFKIISIPRFREYENLNSILFLLYYHAATRQTWPYNNLRCP